MLFAVESGGARAADLMARAVNDVRAAHEFRSLVLDSTAVDATMDLVSAYNQKAQDALCVLQPSVTREGLAQIPQQYLDGILAEKVPS